MDGIQTFCFLDTDVLLHFQTFDEVDWVDVLQAPNQTVCLVLAPSVMQELNQHKDDGRNGGRQKRARMLLSKLHIVLPPNPVQPGELRPGIRIMDIAIEPYVDWSQMGLDENVLDDRFIASVIAFGSDHEGSQVSIITNDFALQRKAKSRGINVIDPDGTIENLNDESDDARKIKTLERENQSLRNAIPKLELRFVEDDEHKDRIEVRDTRQKNSPPSLSSCLLAIEQKRSMVNNVLNQAKLQQVSESKIRRFSTEFDDYLQMLEPALVMERSFNYGTRCRLELVLLNEGAAPASDVIVRIWLPKGTFSISESKELLEFWNKVSFPKEPRPSWAPDPNEFSLFSGLGIVAPIPTPTISDPKPRGPIYGVRKRDLIRYEHPKLRQTFEWRMPPLIAYFPPEASRGVQLKYSILADNLGKPVYGQPNIVLH